MRKLFLLLFVVAFVFLLLYRQRLFLWDPLAAVTRDGHRVPDARVRINFTNDILLQDSSGSSENPASHTRFYLVQNWNHLAIAPAKLTCLGRFVCLTDADQTIGDPIPAGTRGRRAPFAGVTMTNRRVEFVDEDGALVETILR